MKKYVVAIPNRKETRNTDSSHYKWLETHQIHFDKAKGIYRTVETALLYQLPHAILFLDFVKNEVSHLTWQIMEVETTTKDGDNTVYFKDQDMVEVPLKEIAEIKAIILARSSSLS